MIGRNSVRSYLAVLFFFTCQPVWGMSCNLALSSQQQSLVESNVARLKGFSRVISFPGFKWPSEMPIELLMTDAGDVMLFRVIAEPYVQGKMGPFSETEGHYSYSLDPTIAKEISGSTVLIAVQNVSRDALKYPSGISPLRRSQLTADTLLEQIMFFREVDVLPELENVVAVVPIEKFRNYLDSQNGIPPSLARLVEAVR